MTEKWLRELPHNWTYIGYNEINYTYTPEGQALLAKFIFHQVGFPRPTSPGGVGTASAKKEIPIE